MEIFDTVGKVIKFLVPFKDSQKRVLIVVDLSSKNPFEVYKYGVCFNTGENSQLEEFRTAPVVVTSIGTLERNKGLNLSRFDAVIGFKTVRKQFMPFYERYLRDRAIYGPGSDSKFESESEITENITAIKLMVLLHFYFNPEEYPEESEAVDNAIIFWVSQEMLRRVSTDSVLSDTYSTTERGNTYVKALCKLPLPIQTWSVPLIDKLTNIGG